METQNEYTVESLVDNQQELIDVVNKLRKDIRKLKINVAALKLVAKIENKKEYKHAIRLFEDSDKSEDANEQNVEDNEQDVEGQEEPDGPEDMENDTKEYTENRSGSGIYKPYRCNACGRGFAYPHTLKHHKVYNCKETKYGRGLVQGKGLIQGKGLVQGNGLSYRR